MALPIRTSGKWRSVSRFRVSLLSDASGPTLSPANIKFAPHHVGTSLMFLFHFVSCIECNCSIGQHEEDAWSISYTNQSVKIYIAPLQDTYSEALPIQDKRKRAVFRRWWNWEQAPFGRCLISTGSPFQVLGQPQKMNGSALSQGGRMGPPNYREQRTGVYDGLHMTREGGRARADWRAPSQTSTATSCFF